MRQSPGEKNTAASANSSVAPAIRNASTRARSPWASNVQNAMKANSYAAAAPVKVAVGARGSSTAARVTRIAISPRPTCPSRNLVLSAARRSSSKNAPRSAPCTPASKRAVIGRSLCLKRSRKRNRRRLRSPWRPSPEQPASKEKVSRFRFPRNCGRLYCMWASPRGDVAANEAAIAKYLEYLQSVKNSSPHTVLNYRRDLEQFLVYLSPPGVRPPGLAGVTHPLIREFVAHLHDQGLQKSSIARKLAALRSFFKYCVREGHLKETPRVLFPRRNCQSASLRCSPRKK